MLADAAVEAAPADRDGDGLTDRFERRWGISDPDRRDTDRDGIWDGHEDEDQDRLSNLGEQRFGTDPSDADSDDDRIRDGRDDSNRNGIRDAVEQDRRPVPARLRPSLTHAYWDLPRGYSNGCHGRISSSSTHACVYGSPRARTKVALFGDSHALQWLPALDQAGKRQRWRVTALTRSACPSVDVDFSGTGFDHAAEACRRWRASAIRWLKQHPQDVVIITNSGRYPLVDRRGDRVYRRKKEPIWQAGLARVLRKLPKRTRIIVLADTPHLKRDPVRCLRSAKHVSECVTRRARALLPRHDRAERRTAVSHGAVFGDLNRTICPYDPCPLLNRGTLMWRDATHLTASYARQLAPSMSRLVSQALPRRSARADRSSEAPTPRAVEIVVFDDRFEPATIEAVRGEEVLVTLTNAGREKHSISFDLGVDAGAGVDPGPVTDPGASAITLLTVPTVGVYQFLDVTGSRHPAGKLVVRAPDGSAREGQPDEAVDPDTTGR